MLGTAGAWLELEGGVDIVGRLMLGAVGALMVTEGWDVA